MHSSNKKISLTNGIKTSFTYYYCYRFKSLQHKSIKQHYLSNNPQIHSPQSTNSILIDSRFFFLLRQHKCTKCGHKQYQLHQQQCHHWNAFRMFYDDKKKPDLI